MIECGRPGTGGNRADPLVGAICQACSLSHDEVSVLPGRWLPRGKDDLKGIPMQHPQEGCTRCACGSKYWDGDTCSSCGQKWDGYDYSDSAHPRYEKGSR